jgi:uncharacterized protein YodC (DUF2158 family)
MLSKPNTLVGITTNFTPYTARPSLKKSRLDSLGWCENIRTCMFLTNSVEHTNLIDVRSVAFRFGFSTLSILKNGAPRLCVPEMCSGEWMCWMPAAYGMRSKSNESEIFDRDMRVAGTARGRTMGRTGKHDVLGMDRR